MRPVQQVVKKIKLRRGDLVYVITGNDKGKKGKILKVLPGEYRAIVEGIRLVTKHTKPSAANPKGSVAKQEAAIHMSNLMLLDPKTGTPTRLGRRRGTDGKLHRFCKKSNRLIVERVST